jgi:hypothetical protein
LNINYLTLFLIVLLAGMTSEAQPKETAVFPQAFFGIYKGTLQIEGESGSSTYPMEFHLLPTDSSRVYRYTLIYGEGESRQVRDYSLLEINKDKGMYVVDEQNGILLDDKVVGNRMYSLFEVQGTLLTTFITFETDHMIFEIVAARGENKKTSGGQTDSIPRVISYPISTVQRAILYKQ